jgi:hypothetical protein
MCFLPGMVLTIQFRLSLKAFIAFWRENLTANLVDNPVLARGCPDMKNREIKIYQQDRGHGACWSI